MHFGQLAFPEYYANTKGNIVYVFVGSRRVFCHTGHSLPTLEAVLGSLKKRAVVSIAGLSRGGSCRGTLVWATFHAYALEMELIFLSSMVRVDFDTNNKMVRWTNQGPIMVLKATLAQVQSCAKFDSVKLGPLGKRMLLMLGRLNWDELFALWTRVKPTSLLKLYVQKGT